jgi:hypothetical protein
MLNFNYGIDLGKETDKELLIKRVNVPLKTVIQNTPQYYSHFYHPPTQPFSFISSSFFYSPLFFIYSVFRYISQITFLLFIVCVLVCAMFGLGFVLLYKYWGVYITVMISVLMVCFLWFRDLY